MHFPCSFFLRYLRCACLHSGSWLLSGLLFPKQESRFLGDRGPLGPRANGQVPPFEIEILD